MVSVEAVKQKKDLTVRENYGMCNLGTIFKGMNTRNRLEHITQKQIFKELERETESE